MPSRTFPESVGLISDEKVTIQSYVDYQATYAYRDVYLSDSGATQLLVYEGPVRFDEPRK